MIVVSEEIKIEEKAEIVEVPIVDVKISQPMGPPKTYKPGSIGAIAQEKANPALKKEEKSI